MQLQQEKEAKEEVNVTKGVTNMDINSKTEMNVEMRN